MSEPVTSELFELELALPDEALTSEAARLIGFDERYQRLRRDLRLLLERDQVAAWSERMYGRALPITSVVGDRYPLVLFTGDVGTGKTATAETAANRLAVELGRPGTLFKLSTRVRGSGHVGQMSTLINQAFEAVIKEAGKKRLSFLILDEADSLAASRDGDHSHHEDKAGVNTLIQKIDQIRRHHGRVLVFLCTNRRDALDPAIMRRVAREERFERPSAEEREALLRLDCDGLGLDDDVYAELVRLTGPVDDREWGLTYSDIRARMLPDALAGAYPERPLEPADLIAAATAVEPTPPVRVAALRDG